MIALPVELTREQHIEAVNQFRQELEKTYKVATTAAIHYEHEHNPHAHLLITTRETSKENDKLYFGEKTRALDVKTTGSQEIERIRETWERTCNLELERAREKARIDRRSFKRQGLKRTPGIHIGARAYALYRKGKHSERMERAIRTREIIELEEQIKNEREKFSEELARLDRIAKERRQRSIRQTGERHSGHKTGRLAERLEESRNEARKRLSEAGIGLEANLTENIRNIESGQSGRGFSVADLIETGRTGNQNREIGTKTISEILAGLDKIKSNQEIKTAAQLLEENRDYTRNTQTRDQERRQNFYSRDL